MEDYMGLDTREVTSFRFNKLEKERLEILAKLEGLKLGRDVSKRDILTSLINQAYEKERKERGVNIE